MPDNQCNVCHIGMLHHRRTTYTQMVDSRLVILPNVSVWLCDVCGEFMYDPQTMRRLSMLLGMPQGTPVSRQRQGTLPEEEQPLSRFSGRRGA